MQSQEEIREALRQQMAQNNESRDSEESSFSDAKLDVIAEKKLMSIDDDEDLCLGWEVSKKKAKKFLNRKIKAMFLFLRDKFHLMKRTSSPHLKKCCEINLMDIGLFAKVDSWG